MRTMVFEKADTLDKGISLMMEGAKKDYYNSSTSNGQKDLGDYYKGQLDNWDKMISITNGKKYIKVVIRLQEAISLHGLSHRRCSF